MSDKLFKIPVRHVPSPDVVVPVHMSVDPPPSSPRPFRVDRRRYANPRFARRIHWLGCDDVPPRIQDESILVEMLEAPERRARFVVAASGLLGDDRITFEV